MQIHKFDPETRETKLLYDTGIPVDVITPGILATTVDLYPGTDKSGQTDPAIGEKPTKDSDRFVYYPSNGRVVKENIKNPDEKKIFNIPGATKLTIDPKNDAVHYIIFDRNIVKESPIGSDKKQFLVKGSDKLTSLSHDPKRNMLIFTNTDAGTIEALDLATNKRTPIYRGLNSPEKVSYRPETRYVFLFIANIFDVPFVIKMVAN